MWRRTIALAGLLALFILIAGCGKSGGGKDVTGPEVPLKLGLVTADVNGRGWASVNAAGRPVAECYLFILSNGDSILHLSAQRTVGNDTLMSAIFMDLPRPRPGTVPLRDTSTATWYVQQVVGADTLQSWWGTAQGAGGTLTLTRLNLAADSAYATFSFAAVAGPDTVRVTNGRLALGYNVVHATGAASRPTLARRSRAPGPGR
jgi:hypothetical protein